jgi:23S rRNA (uridine2552-2'-O)-methyltransferase
VEKTMARRRDRPDYFSRKAHQEQFASRAVYKLAEIDKKYRLFRPGQRLLDLGCAPGSWLQYLSKRVGPTGLVVGVDQQPLKIALPPPVVFIQADIFTVDLEALRRLASEFDGVLSDLAPATSGIKDVDHYRSLTLARRAWEIAQEVLAAGGHFLVKVFAGPDLAAFRQEMTPAFHDLVIVKPHASRQESREVYLLGRRRGHRPPASGQETGGSTSGPGPGVSFSPARL